MHRGATCPPSPPWPAGPAFPAWCGDRRATPWPRRLPPWRASSACTWKRPERCFAPPWRSARPRRAPIPCKWRRLGCSAIATASLFNTPTIATIASMQASRGRRAGESTISWPRPRPRSANSATGPRRCAPLLGSWTLALGPAGDTIRPTVTISWDDITRVQDSPPGTTRTPTNRDQAYLIVLAGSAMGEMFKIVRPQTIIGRGQTAHVRMMDDGISREHCEIQVEGDSMILHDLGSTNGTFCRGLRVDRHVLEDGDKILVGSSTVLKFTYHDSLDEVFQRQMYESALRDDLTKTFNKKYFTDRLESEFAFAMRTQRDTACLSCGDRDTDRG